MVENDALLHRPNLSALSRSSSGILGALSQVETVFSSSVGLSLLAARACNLALISSSTYWGGPPRVSYAGNISLSLKFPSSGSRAPALLPSASTSAARVGRDEGWWESGKADGERLSKSMEYVSAKGPDVEARGGRPVVRGMERCDGLECKDVRRERETWKKSE
jgi:hypothetical protein